MNILELTLPSWMKGPLINSDLTSCSEEDMAQLDKLSAWVSSLGFSAIPLDVSDDEDFMPPSWDARRAYGETLAGDFSEFSFPELPKAKGAS